MASSSRELTIEGVRYELLDTQISDPRSRNFTIEFLRRVSQGGEDLRPTWDEAKQNYVVQKLKYLIEKGKADKYARDTTLIDSGLTNGLALRLTVEGINVSDVRSYSRQMRQYLKKESKIVRLPVLVSQDERNSHQGRRHFQRPADNQITVNIRVSREGWLSTTGCISILGFYVILVVPESVILEEYDIVNRYLLERRVPCALNPDVFIPVSHFLTFLTTTYAPKHSFVGGLMSSGGLQSTASVKLMHAKPHWPGKCETGIIPFMFSAEVPSANIFDSLGPATIDPAIN